MNSFRLPWGGSACLIFIHFLAVGAAQARQDVVPGPRYTSARAAAMGDAYLPLGSDGASALFVNPAGIGNVRKLEFEPMNFSGHLNGGFIDNLGLNSYKAVSLSSNLASLQANPGSSQGMGFSLLPNFATKGFAVGILTQSQVYATADAEGSVRYRSLFQFVPAAAVGVRLAGGIVRLGYSLQWVNQAVGDISAPAGTSPLGYNQSLSEGSGFSHTAGFALTLPIAYLPSLNFVARNMFDTHYSSFALLPISGSSPGAPATESMTFDASFSIQPKIEAGAYMNVVFVYRDITNRSNINTLGRAVLGLEFSFRNKFFLRGGWGSGYPSAGLGFRRKVGEFSFSWFSEEIGASYHDERDIRFMLQYQVRAF